MPFDKLIFELTNLWSIKGRTSVELCNITLIVIEDNYVIYHDTIIIMSLADIYIATLIL